MDSQGKALSGWLTINSSDESNENTKKPVCNDHLCNEINFLWFIQECVLMMIEGTNVLVLTISAFWS